MNLRQKLHTTSLSGQRIKVTLTQAPITQKASHNTYLLQVRIDVKTDLRILKVELETVVQTL